MIAAALHDELGSTGTKVDRYQESMRSRQMWRMHRGKRVRDLPITVEKRL
jgi:hypothetical protein